MKKTIKFFAAALAIVAAASCSKEVANDNTDQTLEQELVHKVFTASLNVDEETKTTLHTDGVTVHWTEGDKIALIPVGKTNASHFSINPESIDGTFADFEGQTVEATDYVGVYPSGLFDYTQSSWDGSMIHYFKGSTLATQYAHVGDFPTTSNGNANIAISTTAKDGHLYFQNVNAYFKFQLAFDNAAEIVISADAVSNDDPKTQSTSTILNLGTQLRYKNGFMYGSSGDSPITFKVDNNKTAFTKNATYYVAIPAVYVTGLKFTVKDANGTEITSFTKSSFTFEQNKIYNLGTLQVKPKTYKIIDQDVHADELKDGAKYVIRAKSSVGRYWKNDNNTLKFTSVGASIAQENVFIFTLTANTDAAQSGYNAKRVGTWKSVVNGLTLDESFNFSANTPVHFTHANRWGSESDYAIDIYKYGTETCMYYYRLAGNWGTNSEAEAANGQSNRKWYISEVTEE